MSDRQYRDVDDLDVMELIIAEGIGIVYLCFSLFMIIGTIYNVADGLIGLYGSIPLDVLLLYPVIGIVVSAFLAHGIMSNKKV